MALTNISQFSLGLRRWQGKVENVRRARTRAVALEALKGVVMGTRVDTGRARGNWQVGGPSPPSGEVDRVDPHGGAVLSAEGRKIQSMSGDDVIWLHNGVPYIGVLEDKDKMLKGTTERLKIWIRSQR